MRLRVVHVVEPSAEQTLIQEKGLDGYQKWLKKELAEQVTEALTKKITPIRRVTKDGTIMYEVYGYLFINEVASDLQETITSLIKEMS